MQTEPTTLPSLNRSHIHKSKRWKRFMKSNTINDVKIPKFWEEKDMGGFIGEFFGTMVLIAFGTGINAGNSLNKTLVKGSGGNWILTALGWGLGVTFGVYTASYFGADGHLNPAVTLAAAVTGAFPLGETISYLVAQVLGAIVGAIIVMGHYKPHFDATPSDQGNDVGIFATGPAIENTTWNFMSEVIATFIFIMALNTLGDFTVGLKPFIVGMLVVGIGISFGGTTGYAINPARDLGPRLAYQFMPLPHKTSANWGYAWSPIAGPIAGAILATLIVNLFS